MGPRQKIVSIQESFGTRVRQLRRAHGLSQDKLGLMVGMERTYISDIERGKRNPSLENIAKLAAGFGLSVSELFEGVGAEPAAGEDAARLKQAADQPQLRYRHISL